MQELPSVDKIFKEEGVVCHSFSTDGTICAVSLKKSHVIEIYKLTADTYRNVNTWKYQCSLKEHQQTVSDLCFSSKNLLLSVSHDKSILVWEQVSDNKWVKQHVTCQNKLGFLKCTWSPNGKKFAAGSSDHRVYVGYWDSSNNWWTTLVVASFKSSISALSFHPSSKLLFVGSMDLSMKLLSVDLRANYSHDIESLKGSQARIAEHHRLYKDQLEQEDLKYDAQFAHFNSYAEVLVEFSHTTIGGWVTAAAFSPDGNTVTFSSHNSLAFTLSVTPEGLEPTQQDKQAKSPLYLKGLPIRCMLYKDNTTILCGMFDGSIIEIENKNNTLKEIKKIESGLDQSVAAKQRNAVGSTTQMWERRQLGSSAAQAASTSGHQTTVLCVQRYPTNNGTFILSSNDARGNIFFW